MTARRILPIILCGGAGSRLWPLSRETFPKPFVKLPDGSTLIAHTLERIAAVASTTATSDVNVLPTIVVTHKDHAHLVTAAARDAGFAPPGAVIEPIARNTAAAVASAALRAQALYGDSVTLLILTADHLISPLSVFAKVVSDAMAIAGDDRLVTFGIKPTSPETGYGYIEAGAPIQSGGATGFAVSRFVEKPPLETAKHYVASGRFFWNSGMFVLPVGQLIAEFENHATEVLSAARNALKAARVIGDSVHLDLDSYKTAPSISFDYAIMERTQLAAMVPADFSWTDIGSWPAFAAMVDAEADGKGNGSVGSVKHIDSERTFVLGGRRMIATLGVSDLAIIDTDDALLVARMDRSQDVKKIFDELRANGDELATHPLVIRRPWGTYRIIDEGPGFKTKRITVDPGASISLQMHQHRSEHWTIVSGTAEVEINDTKQRCVHGDHVYVPLRAKHRIRNLGSDDVVFIEVQTGAILEESDIQRFEDQYGRV
jgi:mannose-1-phosphate guanylyltransferase / mannose-6-phosphate isomerase